MIQLNNITKKYGDVTIIDNLDLTIHDGEICVFIGPSGCGKSTTLKMINRMIEPTGGSILINGQNIMEQDENKLRMNIGYVIQQIGLLPHKTVAENVALVPRLFRWDNQKIAARVDELLDKVGLNPDEYRNKYPKQLSGGQMQRVGVARALAVDPPIMLMDEPFGAVDPITRKSIQDEFLQLQKSLRKTICFVTHDIDEAVKMGDRIAIFNNKTVEQIDTPLNILLKPKNEFVKEFVGLDRQSKSYQFIQVQHIVNFLKEKNELGDASNFYAVDVRDTIDRIINIMVNEYTNEVCVLDGNDYIGSIKFKDISRYLISLGGA